MNLYKLEGRKLRFSAYFWAVFGIFISLLTLSVFFLFLSALPVASENSYDETELFASWNGLLSLITALGFACFSVLSTVLANSMIIREYCGRNAVVLLCYPIRRRVILCTKCLLICGITITAASISQTLLFGILFVTARIFEIVPQLTTGYFSLTVLLSSVLMGFLSSALGIISVTIGWKKHSSMTAIVCTVILICLLTNLIAIAPKHLLFVLLVMSACLAAIANLMYHILADGIEQMEV